jgi:uncharacterized protein (TIGR03435 family)
MPIYALLMARPGVLGPSFRPSTERTTFRQGNGSLTGRAVPLSNLVDVLAFAVQRTVVDRTGLSEKYDVDLHWTPFGNETSGANSPPPDAPSIFTAVQEQLGLKLQSAKGPVDVLVIDHVERPTPD